MACPCPTVRSCGRAPTGGGTSDARWDAARLVVEIDGAHHRDGAHPIVDALRQNALAIDGDRVLRIPNIGLRSDPDAFLDQIETALIAEGVVEKHAP